MSDFYHAAAIGYKRRAEGPFLASVAQIQGNVLWLGTRMLEEPPQPWTWRDLRPGNDDPVLTGADDLTSMLYDPTMHSLVAAKAGLVINSYLNRGYLPHRIATRTTSDKTHELEVRTTLPTVTVYVPPSTKASESNHDLPQYRTVPAAEYVGSALWAAFQVVRGFGSGNISRVRFGSDEQTQALPLRYFFSA